MFKVLQEYFLHISFKVLVYLRNYPFYNLQELVTTLN